jgi:hypothetical protein
MKFLKKYREYLESVQYVDDFSSRFDLTESLKIWYDSLMLSIGAEEVNPLETFSLGEKFRNNLDLEYLNKNIEFINSLSSIGLKKSPPESTDDYETFINKPCKFMMIYDVNSNELEGAEYMLFQTYNETTQSWGDTKLYKMNIKGENLKDKFYDKLTSRKIEIIDGPENYIYSTSNGNDWNLENRESSNDIWKPQFRKDELENLIDKRKPQVNII